jgi:voltage-gated potassium channel
MTTAAVSGAPSTGSRTRAERRRARRRLVGLVARTVLVTSAMVAFYVSAPLNQRPVGAIAARLALELLALVGVLVWQIRAVARSAHPVMRGVEAVVVSVPLLVLTFGATYVVVEHNSPGSFTEALTRLDAAYFSVTVLATVGFGDISPVSELARSLVMAQMLVDLAFVGLVAKVLVGAVRRRRDEMQIEAATASAAEAEPT